MDNNPSMGVIRGRSLSATVLLVEGLSAYLQLENT